MAWMDWGPSPMCPMTGIPRSTIAAAMSMAGRSSFTAWAPPSFRNLPALRTPSSTVEWNDMNGMSPTTIAFLTARATARQ